LLCKAEYIKKLAIKSTQKGHLSTQKGHLTESCDEDSEFLAPTQQKTEPQPRITREGEPYQMSDEAAKQSVELPRVVELEILRDRILSQLKLGKQATGYKTAQKVLNRFIAELIGSV